MLENGINAINFPNLVAETRRNAPYHLITPPSIPQKHSPLQHQYKIVRSRIPIQRTFGDRTMTERKLLFPNHRRYHLHLYCRVAIMIISRHQIPFSYLVQHLPLTPIPSGYFQPYLTSSPASGPSVQHLSPHSSHIPITPNLTPVTSQLAAQNTSFIQQTMPTDVTANEFT